MTTHGQHSWDQPPVEPPATEQIRVPLYDTWEVMSGGATSFFQCPRPGPQGLEEYTNVLTAGCLSWPKTYDVEGLELDIPKQVDVGGMSVRFCIGEDVVIHAPLVHLKTEKGYAIKGTAHIPTMQNFRVVIEGGRADQAPFRCVVRLIGVLTREKAE